MTARTPASWMQNGSHPAENDRNILSALVGTPGIVGPADLAVTANGTPNMTVNVAAGAAFVQGTEATYQGVYHAFNDATVNLAIAASDPTNPRIDIVVAQVRDDIYSGSNHDFRLVVVTGTPAGAPAAPATPADSIVLARVAVAHSVTSIVAGNITDYRALATDQGGARGTLPGGYAPVTVVTGPAMPPWSITSVTVTVAAGRRIRVSCQSLVYSSVTSDLCQIVIMEGGSILQIGQSPAGWASGGASQSASVILTPTTGTHTYNIWVSRAGGTGSLTNYASSNQPTYILAEDIGV